MNAPTINARVRTRPPTTSQQAAPPPAKPVKSRAVSPFVRPAKLEEGYEPPNIVRRDNQAYDTPARKLAMIDAMQQFLGVVHYACLATDTPRATHYKWMNEDSEYKRGCDEASAVALDYVEAQLLTNIRHGDPTSAIFYLKTRGKQRGFVERTEVTGAGGEAININLSVEQVKEDLPMQALQAVLLKTVFKDGTVKANPALPPS